MLSDSIPLTFTFTLFGWFSYLKLNFMIVCRTGSVQMMSLNVNTTLANAFLKVGYVME